MQVSLPGPREGLREVAESGGGGIENRQSSCTGGHKQGSDREEREGTEVRVQDQFWEWRAGSGLSRRLAGSPCGIEDLPPRIITFLSVLGC